MENQAKGRRLLLTLYPPIGPPTGLLRKLRDGLWQLGQVTGPLAPPAVDDPKSEAWN